MPCFEIPYTDGPHQHISSKWADTPAEALKLAQKAHKKKRGGESFIVYGTPRLANPQPFTDEGRAATADRFKDVHVQADVEAPPAVAIHFDAPEADEIGLTADHMEDAA